MCLNSDIVAVAEFCTLQSKQRHDRWHVWPAAGGALPPPRHGEGVHGEALAVPGPHPAGHPAQGNHLLLALGCRHLYNSSWIKISTTNEWIMILGSSVFDSLGRFQSSILYVHT